MEKKNIRIGLQAISHILAVTSTFLILLLAIHSCNLVKRSQYHQPAEFEPVLTTYFVWSDAFYEIIPKLAALISEKDSVTLILDQNVNDITGVLSVLEKYNGRIENIGFVKMNFVMDNYWLRDFGPAYLINNKNKKKMLMFNYFGNENTFMKAYKELTDLPVERCLLNGSGGARDANGKGTMLLCEAHELDVNSPKSKEQIEKEMMKTFNLEKIIWLKKGVPQDDSYLTGPLVSNIYPSGVNGHIDEFCRFASPNTVLLTAISDYEARQHPILGIAKSRMDENYQILTHSSDQDGNKLNVIPVPIAPLFINKKELNGSVQSVATVTSYMNFIVTNHRVILPSYVNNDSERTGLVRRELHIKDIFQEAFPTREIVRVRADSLNYYSGGFHCISLNEPDTNRQ